MSGDCKWTWQVEESPYPVWAPHPAGERWLLTIRSKTHYFHTTHYFGREPGAVEIEQAMIQAEKLLHRHQERHGARGMR